MILILILILILIFVIYYYFSPYKNHKFWDKQPVSRNNCNLKKGFIGIIPKFNTKLENNYVFKHLNIPIKSNEIVSFINNHFSDNYKYSNKFLVNTLTYNNIGYNMGLFHNNNLIGFIHTKPIKLIIKKTLLNLYYVDFLCVHKKYRRKNLAAILISKLINDHKNKTQCFIFKKESKSLPFNYITKTNYYYLNLNFVKIQDYEKKYTNIIYANKNNLIEIYNFIIKQSKKHDIYQYFNEKEFLELYSDSSKKIIIEKDSENKICGYIIYVEILFRLSNFPLKTIDIEHMYISKKSSLFEFLINESYSNKIEIISCLDISNNTFIINKYKMLKSLPIFYHMYNYHISTEIPKKQMCFNYL
jgi:hypothetical protein